MNWHPYGLLLLQMETVYNATASASHTWLFFGVPGSSHAWTHVSIFVSKFTYAWLLNLLTKSFSHLFIWLKHLHKSSINCNWKCCFFFFFNNTMLLSNVFYLLSPKRMREASYSDCGGQWFGGIIAQTQNIFCIRKIALCLHVLCFPRGPDSWVCTNVWVCGNRCT